MTPAVEAISRLHITGNVTPHVWYQRTEFRTSNNRPDRDMITALADIMYWYRPREVRDEDTGEFVAFERKFERDMLQYDYARRGAIFGMSWRQMSEACKKLSRAGLIRIEYRTLTFKGRAQNNVVFIEPVAEAIAATLTQPNAEVKAYGKGAKRGMHARKADAGQYEPLDGIDGQGDDETDGSPELVEQAEGQADEQTDTPLLQNFGTGGEDPSSKILGHPSSKILGEGTPKFWETNNETSSDISSNRDFNSSIITGTELEASPADDDGPLTPDGEQQGPVTSEPSADDDDLPFFTGVGSHVEGTKLTQPTEVPDVPPAAPAPVDNAVDETWAILALQPIPLATLAARPARDPSQMRQLRALMQATNPKRLGHLQEQLALTLPGGVSRQYLTRLTDEEVAAAAKAASHDATRVKGGMGSAGYHALDRLLGKEFTVEMLSGQPAAPRASTEAPTHRSHQVANTGRIADDTPPVEEADGAMQPGRQWQHKKSGEVVVIAAVEGSEVVLTDGARHSMAKFVTTFKRAVSAQAAS
ncbi:hypothetical protein [Deinococcus grandis]|nr:hypothetical protein [Deinococcus grandis]